MTKNFLLLIILSLALFFSFPLKAEKKSEKTKKETVPIIITSEQAIWDNKKEITTLTEKVVVIRGADHFLANKMEIWGNFNDLKKIIGYEDIKILNQEEQVNLTGSYFEYDKEKDYALVTGNPVLISEKDKLEITSQKMEKYFKDYLFIAIGKVKVKKEDTRATGEKLHFFEKEKKAILTGSPQLFQEKNTFSGEKIVFYLNEDKVEVYGKVKSTVYLEEKTKK
ncbi:hypothetical protein KKB54_01025 [bacterium]|nr:hypothetical protein [bacterium]MBU1153740.1 hypothetical protein [bacterium]